VSGVLIRAMAVEDVPAVSAIDRVCFSYPWTEATFVAETASTVGYYRVAERAGEVVGYIGSQMILDEAHITTFGVRPDQRRHGVGERLLADLLRKAVRGGCHRVTLEVRETNAPAICLYRKYGFSPVSRRRAYYHDGEDAVVMWIEDTTRLAFRTLFDERLAALGQS